MPDPSARDDLLLSLQSSLRNACQTFGPKSRQYTDIVTLITEHMSKTRKGSQQEINDLISRMSEVGIRGDDR
ncbi:hypothetical protein CC78DRAFT_531055 [Lojkania enalia]|uniref:Uncharacterized protein n=1 Tax=Lojkania enalia TaxID=147567 RepID=A0A9P4KFX2_9PLEO|nr:hypothetical protein CC78DRAFT_531055 [Didymosphaeria enalia]